MSTATITRPDRVVPALVAALSANLHAAISERAQRQRGGLDTAEETKRIRDLLGARHDALRDAELYRTDLNGARVGGDLR